jgi:hypothetical protein
VRDAIERHIDFPRPEVIRVAETEERRILSLFKP